MIFDKLKVKKMILLKLSEGELLQAPVDVENAREVMDIQFMATNEVSDIFQILKLF